MKFSQVDISQKKNSVDWKKKCEHTHLLQTERQKNDHRNESPLQEEAEDPRL